MKDWKKVKLGSLLTESKIISANPDTDRRLRVRLNMLGVEKRPNINDKEGATKYYVRKAGQFIYGKQNLHKGAFGVVPKELNGFESSSDIPAFDVDESCYPEWIYYFFKKGNFYAKLVGLAKGVGSKRIQPEQIYGFDIYLPTKDEQKRILKEIEKVEIKNRNLIKEIQLQEENLTVLRQSILSEAIKGELSKEWREQNPNIQSGVDLLDRIIIDKEKLIKEEDIKRQNPLPLIKKEEIPFEIPKSWRWERLDNIKDPRKSISYGVLIPGPNVSDGVPLIRVSDLEFAGTGKQPEKSISNEINLKHKKTILEGNEILITVVGSTIGKVVISDVTWKGANIARAIARLKIHELLETNFFYLVLTTPYIQSLFTSASRTIGQPTLNISFIENTLVPVPPREEQKIIIEKVNILLLNCAKIEAEAIVGKENLEQLMQSFLYDLLGDERNVLINKVQHKNKIEIPLIEKKYNSKNVFMELTDLLKEHSKLHAEDLWKMSKHFDNKNIGESIDKFYADLKQKIEVDKTIKEVENEKGYLELV